MSLLLRKEIWKVVKDHRDYAVSNLGRVKRITPPRMGNRTYVGKILKPKEDKKGYLRVCLNRKNIYVHNLVLNEFIGPRPEKMECNHEDGIKQNCKLENLEWTTKSENNKHAYRLGLKILQRPDLRGEKSPCSKLKSGEIWLIRKLYNSRIEKDPKSKLKVHFSKLDRQFIADMFHIDISHVGNIGSGRRWHHTLEEDENAFAS